MMSELHFFVFSYNRGEFLANCIRSIEACAPDFPVTIIDDHSTDNATRDVLASIGQHHRVLDAGSESGHKHGGLYANMEMALEIAPENGIACFLQDDTQLVRAITSTDSARIARAFSRNTTLAFISPCFLRGRARQRKGGMHFSYDADNDLYFPKEGRHSAGVFYSDVVLADVARLRTAGWQFARGEPANQAAAAASFGPMAYLPVPFMMWLPSVPAYRGRTKSLTLRLAENRRRCGLYPLAYLSASEVQRLSGHRMDHPPVAEHWLTSTVESLSYPWFYDPLNGSRWLKYMDRIEWRLRRWASNARTRLPGGS